MKLDLILSALVALPLAACDMGDTDLGELETETSASSGESDSQTSGGSDSQTSGGSDSQTSGGSDSQTSGSESESESESETESSSSSGGGLYPAACEAAGWVDSYEAWQEAAASGNYTYVAEDATYIDLGDFQCLYNTTITVENGEVVRRAFQLLDQADGATCEQDFIEMGDSLGDSDVPLAHPPITMDEVYLTCCENQLDLPEEDWTPNFSVNDAGLFRHCSAQMTGCGDGCSQGGAGQATIIEYTFE